MLRLTSLRLKDHKLAIVTLGVMLYAIVMACCCPLLTSDTCCRSAPMAEAFAAGDWIRVFHPRFGIGFSVFPGIVRLVTGVDGYTACSIVASIAWAISIVPLFYLSRHIFDETTAWFAVILYLIAPAFFTWSLMGLRESCKMLGLLTMADAVFRCREGSWRNFAEAVVGLALLMFFKVDSILYGILLARIYVSVDQFHRRGCLLLLAVIVLLQPSCLLVYKWTGIWVPVPQCVSLVTRIMGGM